MISAPILRTILLGAILIFGLGILISIGLGVRALRTAANIQYFRARHERLVSGWLALFLALVFVFFGLALFRFSDAIINQAFPLTPTQTLPPTFTPSPSFTSTVFLSPTFTPSPTPFIPPLIGIRFESKVTPGPEIKFSEIMFTEKVDELYRPLLPGKSFKNPLDTLYALFHYEGLEKGVQWTALWWREKELVYFETKVWDSAPEGFALSNWKPQDVLDWQPGQYQVQLFVGLDWKQSGDFYVEGQPATYTPTGPLSPTATFTLTPSITPSVTITPSLTQTSSLTPTSTQTRTPSPTITPRPTRTATPTRTPTRTPLPTSTPTLTRTPSLTVTLTPTRTQTVTSTSSVTTTNTLTPTLTPTRSATSTSTRTDTFFTATASETGSVTPTLTLTQTPRPTQTITLTYTATHTPTSTSTYTPRPTSTPRPALLPWRSATPSSTISATAGGGATPINTLTSIMVSTPWLATRTPYPLLTFPYGYWRP